MNLLISMGCLGLVLGMGIAIVLIYAQMYRLSRPPGPPECEICGGRIVGKACEFCGQEWEGDPYDK
jgi:hypothetical protein